MTNTPRTDEFDRSMNEQYEILREAGWPANDLCNYADFARTLERELVAAKAEIERLTGEVARFKHIRALLIKSLCRATGNTQEEIENAPFGCAVAANAKLEAATKRIAELEAGK